MNLSRYEKLALFRFIGVYIVAITIVIVGFSYLLYSIDIESLKDHIYAKLRADARKIAYSAIDAQMLGKKFQIDKNIHYQLLAKNETVLQKNFDEQVDTHKEFYIDTSCAYYIDTSAKGHMGISYVVVRDCSYQNQKAKIAKRVIFFSLLAYLFLLIVGWYLAKLFMQPLKDKIEELDRFIKDSTHELNTPITTILLALSKLKEQSKYVQIAQMGAKKISKIYDDLTYLNFGSKDKKQSINIEDIVQDNIGFFSLLLKQKRLQIKTDIAPCTIVAKQKDIDLIIKNLLDNAIKYAPANTTITIQLHNCQFRITNRGSIPKEKLQTIFNRYQRADSVQGGFGIGLDIIQQICKKNGYNIAIQTEGQNVAFTIDFSQKA